MFAYRFKMLLNDRLRGYWGQCSSAANFVLAVFIDMQGVAMTRGTVISLSRRLSHAQHEFQEGEE